MFTKQRISAEGYLALQRKYQAWGFVVGVVIGLALTYFLPWIPSPSSQFSTWLISIAVVGALCAVAGAYLADLLTDDKLEGAASASSAVNESAE